MCREAESRRSCDTAAGVSTVKQQTKSALFFLHARFFILESMGKVDGGAGVAGSG